MHSHGQLGCLPHSSASPFDEIPPIYLECKTVVFVDGVPSWPASSNVEISVSVSRSIYRRPQVPQGIQQSMLVQMVVLEERN